LDGADLYRSNYRIVISDLGQSEFLNVKVRQPRTGQTGTLGFVAPELKTMHIVDQTKEKNQQSSNDDTWNEQSDIWSLGHILYFLAFNLWPYDGQESDEKVLYRKIIHQNLRLQIPSNSGRSTTLIDTINELTQIESHKRPTLQHIILRINEILRYHSYINTPISTVTSSINTDNHIDNYYNNNNDNNNNEINSSS